MAIPDSAPFDPPTAFEFFAGGGLAGLGLSGFRTVFANDIDAAKAASWRANHSGLFRLGDVWDLTPDDLPGRPDLVWASSPCQDLSLAGPRGGLDARRSGAFWGFWRLMQGLEAVGRGPRVVVIENVTGLLTSGEGRDFADVCGALTEAGYRIGALEIDAALWLPQSRPRLFIIAMRDVESVTWSGPRAPFHTARLVAAHDRLPPSVRARWVWWAMSEPPARALDLFDILEPDDQVRWFGEAETASLLDLLAPLHRERLETARAVGARRVAAGYRRVRQETGIRTQRLELRFDGLAGCLRTPSGGSSRQYVVVCRNGTVSARRLTAREAARLMGLDDAYVLPASEKAALKLLGDAVAVPVVRALSEQVMEPALRQARRAA